jgi:hypothetical protein
MIFVLSENPTSFFLGYASDASCFSKPSIMNRQNSRTEGEKTHKVMDCVHVTKTRDPVTQRHERIGTETIYEHLAEKDVSVKIHAHDRNLSINKFIKDT